MDGGIHPVRWSFARARSGHYVLWTDDSSPKVALRRRGMHLISDVTTRPTLWAIRQKQNAPDGGDYGFISDDNDATRRGLYGASFAAGVVYGGRINTVRGIHNACM